MTERENLINDLCAILIEAGCLTEDIKQRIVLAMSEYEVQWRTTDVVVADPNDNANVIQRFMVAKAVAGRSKQTIEQYVLALKHLIRITGKQLVDLKPEDFQAYLAHRMVKDKVKASTILNDRNYISSFYDWAVKTEIVLRNPVKMTDSIKVPRIQKKAFTELELEKLRAACKNMRERALVEVLLSTACRVSEIVSIKTCEIDDNRVMVLGKGNKYGQVYLSPRATYAIENYINSRKDNSPFLFPGRKEDRPCTDACIQRTVKAIGDRAGVANVHPHRFRRTAATMALRHGMSLEMVSKMLRHDRLETTMIYLDLDSRELEYQHQKYVG